MFYKVLCRFVINKFIPHLGMGNCATEFQSATIENTALCGIFYFAPHKGIRQSGNGTTCRLKTQFLCALTQVAHDQSADEQLRKC